MAWKVEIRTDCIICHKPLPNKRFRTFCSTKCRNRSYAIKNTEYQAEWQRNYKDKQASIPFPGRKIQCLDCGKWYVQVGTHVVQKHGYKTCREYREHHNLEVKRGIVPQWYRELKGDLALENETVNNLKIGKKYWFKPGDKRAGNYKRSPITIERLKHLKQNYANIQQKRKTLNDART